MKDPSETQQHQNTPKKRSGRSRFKGVSQVADGWQAHIGIGRGASSLGVFANEEEAARAYDQAALKRFAAYACTNEMLGLFERTQPQWGEVAVETVARIAAQPYERHPDYDEIKQICAYEILKQVESCRNRGVRGLEVYFIKRCRVVIALWFASEKKRKTAQLYDTDEPTEADAPTRCETVDFLKTQIKHLDQAEQQLLRLRFWKDKTLEQIGQHFGLDERRAGEWLAAVLLKMRDANDG